LLGKQDAAGRIVTLKTEMNHREHGVHGVQTKEGLGFAKSGKAKGGLTQKMITHQLIKAPYLLPSVLSTVLCGSFLFFLLGLPVFIR
jgi:hypothetical protein